MKKDIIFVVIFIFLASSVGAYAMDDLVVVPLSSSSRSSSNEGGSSSSNENTSGSSLSLDEKQLRKKNGIDSLTDLQNIKLFLDQREKYLVGARKGGEAFVWVIEDISTKNDGVPRYLEKLYDADDPHTLVSCARGKELIEGKWKTNLFIATAINNIKKNNSCVLTLRRVENGVKLSEKIFSQNEAGKITAIALDQKADYVALAVQKRTKELSKLIKKILIFNRVFQLKKEIDVSSYLHHPVTALAFKPSEKSFVLEGILAGTSGGFLYKNEFKKELSPISFKTLCEFIDKLAFNDDKLVVVGPYKNKKDGYKEGKAILMYNGSGRLLETKYETYKFQTKDGNTEKRYEEVATSPSMKSIVFFSPENSINDSDGNDTLVVQDEKRRFKLKDKKMKGMYQDIQQTQAHYGVITTGNNHYLDVAIGDGKAGRILICALNTLKEISIWRGLHLPQYRSRSNSLLRKTVSDEHLLNKLESESLCGHTTLSLQFIKASLQNPAKKFSPRKLPVGSKEPTPRSTKDRPPRPAPPLPSVKKLSNEKPNEVNHDKKNEKNFKPQRRAHSISSVGISSKLPLKNTLDKKKETEDKLKPRIAQSSPNLRQKKKKVSFKRRISRLFKKKKKKDKDKNKKK